MEISKYFATLGFKVDPKDIRKIDNHLNLIESKLKMFGKKIGKHLKISLDIDKFDVDQRKLNASLGSALDVASSRLVFQVNNFDINQTRLNQQMSAAMMRAARSAAVSPTVNPKVRGSTAGSITQRHAVMAGGVGGITARAYTPVLALAMGGYGLANINRTNQEVISAQLTTQAVTEAAGLKGKGPEAFDWLRNQANRVGFSYMDQVESYNNFLSNALGAGMGLGGAQDIYLGFAEYSRAMGISPARNKLVMNALSQMMGKGTVSMEELKRQMAESMPGTMDVFAQAYAQMTGSGLQGQEALAALYKAVPTGKVKSAELLPIVQEILRQRAAPKLDIAMKTSQAEQARLKNAMATSAIGAAGAGVESGFARIFKSLTTALIEAQPAIEGMAKAFDEISKYVSFAILLPQSIRRAFEGRDSWVADMIGKSNVKIAKDFYDGLKELGSTLKETLGIAFEGWKGIFEAFGPTILDVLNKIKDVFLYTFKMLNSIISGNLTEAANYGRAMTASLAGASPEEVKALAEGKPIPTDATNTVAEGVQAWQAYSALPDASNPMEWIAKQNQQRTLRNQYMDARNRAINDPSSVFFQKPEEYDRTVQDQFSKVMAGQGYMPQTNVTVEAGAFQINTQATNGEQLAKELEPHVQSIIKNERQKEYTTIASQLPQKE